jgi:hypothetical protein
MEGFFFLSEKWRIVVIKAVIAFLGAHPNTLLKNQRKIIKVLIR